MSQSARPQGVSPAVALAFAVIGFVALLVFGLGMLSLLLDRDVIEVPGLGQMPGVIGAVVATGLVAAALWSALRRRRPSFGASLTCAAGAYIGYIVGVWLGAAFTGVDLAAAAAAAGGVALSGFGLVLAAAGLIAGWGGVALVRTRSDRPRWPWERNAD